MVFRLQFIAVQAADFLSYHGRAAAEARADIKTTVYREIAARARRCETDFKLVASMDGLRLPLSDGFAVEFAGRSGTGNNDAGVELRFEYQAAKADLETGRIRIVVQQSISPVESKTVERATGGQAQVVRTKTAAILQQAE